MHKKLPIGRAASKKMPISQGEFKFESNFDVQSLFFPVKNVGFFRPKSDYIKITTENQFLFA